MEGGTSANLVRLATAHRPQSSQAAIGATGGWLAGRSPGRPRGSEGRPSHSHARRLVQAVRSPSGIHELEQRLLLLRWGLPLRGRLHRRLAQGVAGGQRLFGIGQEDTYQQKRDKRFRKTSKWLTDQSTPLRQGTATTVAGPAVALMGDFFRAACLEIRRSRRGCSNSCTTRATPRGRCVADIVICSRARTTGIGYH